MKISDPRSTLGKNLIDDKVSFFVGGNANLISQPCDQSEKYVAYFLSVTY